MPGRGPVRDYPRLKHGGQHLANARTRWWPMRALPPSVPACWLSRLVAVAGMASAVVGRGDSTAASGGRKSGAARRFCLERGAAHASA